jgi:hypothetical protein
MQLIRDFAKAPFNELRILDFACGEGVYAIEAALRCANVVAFDANRGSRGFRGAISMTDSRGVPARGRRTSRFRPRRTRS